MEKLSDIVSHAGLHGYAEVALVLFLIAFLLILLRVLSPRRKQELEDLARLPFDSDPPSPQRKGAKQ
ncbi:MAG TPA: CcoQ/FixQ family Cbb3-type cytochrome c oxidase assembly chaperone [Candidatus Sulfotelmatobacter sp.]|nr:CcoQ/FixQ family Cbb3-type cytochrome c oxidase assembly chaperone [Candidatus Sulfotelmatobacter sp.]